MLLNEREEVNVASILSVDVYPWPHTVCDISIINIWLEKNSTNQFDNVTNVNGIIIYHSNMATDIISYHICYAHCKLRFVKITQNLETRIC